MPPKVVVSARIPRDWADQLQLLADAQDSDVSKVVKEAIAHMLTIETPESTIALQHRVSRLEAQLDSLIGIASMTAANREGRSRQEPVHHP